MTTDTYSGIITVAERDEIRWTACELLARRYAVLTSGDTDSRDLFEHIDRYNAIARVLGSLGMDLFEDSLPQGGFEHDGLRVMADGLAELEDEYRTQVEDRHGDPEYRDVAVAGLGRIRRAKEAMRRLHHGG